MLFRAYKMLSSYKFKSVLPASLLALYLRLKAVLSALWWPSFASTAKEPGMFFIIGSGRSGNTLLRSMLMAGGEICIPPESYVLPRTIAMFQAYGFLPWPQLASIIISEFESFREFDTWATDLSQTHKLARELPVGQRSYENIIGLIYQAYQAQHFPKTRLLGDKTPINTVFLARVSSVFCRSKYIHILRDPRACVASYVKAGLLDIEQAIDFWLVATSNAIKLGKRLGQRGFIRVEYESLVMDPQPTLSRICDFLEVSYSDDMLSFWQHPDRLGDVGARAHHKNTRSPLSKSSINAWRNDLSAQDIERIERLCLPLYKSITLFRQAESV